MKLPTFAFLALLVGLATPCGAEVFVLDFDSSPPAGRLSVADIPNGAGRYVVDESGSLPPELQLKTESTLSKNFTAPTFLIIKEGRLPVAPDLFGNELLRRWIVHGRHLSAVVISVTDPLPETHVVLAGRNLSSTDIQHLDKLGTSALALSSLQSGQAEGAAATALALVPALATFAAAYDGAPAMVVTTESSVDEKSAAPPAAKEATTPPVEYTPVTISHWDKLSAKLDWPLIRAVSAIVGGVMFLVLGAIFLPRLFRKQRYYFPEIDPRSRFSAPFAGGSNAQIKFRA
jgi:hypothetical protein